MFGKINRLKKRKQFNYVFKKGQSINSKNIVLVYAGSKQKNYKIGYSISKKVGKAVIRNLIKRRMKEAFRLLELNLCNEYNFILVAKPIIVDALFDDIKRDIEYCFVKAGLVRSSDENN